MPVLSAGRRKLYSNQAYGQPVFAATFIRKRRIVLDQELARQKRELARILTHEIFHFTWVRLSNQSRRSFQALLRREWTLRAQGELGWSSELRKSRLLRGRGRTRPDPKKFRDYACESFCDTAAWFYTGIHRHHEFTLAQRHRVRRAEWFRETFRERRIPI
jgi:hypothetical protein